MIYQAFYDNDVMVNLTDEEYEEAYERGISIHQVSDGWCEEQHTSRDGVTGDRIHGLGEVAGRAIAKALGIPWTNSLNTFKKADLAYDIEARLIGKDHYGLRVYDDDYSAKRVVGCVIPRGCERKPYRIPGWINAKYGKREEWKRDWLNRHRPVYCVPQERLEPLTALMDLIAKAALTPS
jgi:hypothetical protein